MEQTINRIRFYHYISGVLKNQAADPLCIRCKPYANTVRAMKEGIAKLEESEKDELPAELIRMHENAAAAINALQTPEDTEGQKTAGNCKMPKGVCFAKSSKALLKKVEEPDSD